MKVIDHPNPTNFLEIKFKRALIRKLISLVNCMILTSGFLHFYETIDYCHKDLTISAMLYKACPESRSLFMLLGLITLISQIFTSNSWEKRLFQSKLNGRLSACTNWTWAIAKSVDAWIFPSSAFGQRSKTSRQLVASMTNLVVDAQENCQRATKTCCTHSADATQKQEYRSWVHK